MTQLLQENFVVSPGNAAPRFLSELTADHQPAGPMTAHRVVLFSPHPLLLAGLRAELHQFPGFKVVAETGNASDLLELVGRTPLSLIIFDPARPGETLRLVRSIQKSLKSPVPMIVLNGETTGQVAQLKALGVIQADKELDTANFKGLVEKAVHGRRPLPRIRFNDTAEARDFPILSKQARSVSPVVENPEPAGKLPLSQRELQILAIIGQGCTNKEVAETLCISSHTLKNHLNNIFKKLAVEDRTQALMVCVRRGWVTL